MDDPRGAVDRESFREAARAAPAGARVPVELRTTVADPFRAYRRARRDAGGFYLETTGGQSGWGYFGVAPAERLTVAPDAVVADELVDDASDDPGRSDGPGGGSRGTGRAADSASLSALGGLLEGETLTRGDCEVPYPCGAVGWLSYDVARELESLPATTTDDRTLPRLQVGVYDAMVAWPEPRNGPVELRVTVCPALPDDRGGAVLDDVYERARERGRALVHRIQEGDPGVADPPVVADEATFTAECGRAEYADRVRRVKELIRAGDTFQANVAQRLVAAAAVHPVEAFDALRAVNPAPYAGLVEFPGVDLVSASPELLLHVEPPEGLNAGRFGEFDPPARSRLVTEPIAGTRPRADDQASDEALARDLVGDEKERAEHAMLVDLERNDLGKVAAYGSVDVAEYRRVDRYAEVMHLVSLVEGRLREDRSVVDAVAAMFPGGTITGAPKPRTMEIIESVEDRRRGPYTGSIGLFGFDGRATLNIVIRTLVRTGEEYGLRVGAGIVHDSDPEREYEETLDKARALVTAVDRALDRRDLAVEGGGGGPEEAVDPASEPDGGTSR